MIEGEKIKKYEKFYDEIGELKEKFSEASERMTPIPSSFPTIERLISFMTTQHTTGGDMTPPPSFVVIHEDMNRAVETCDEAVDVLNIVNEYLAEIDADIANLKDKSKIDFLEDKKKLLIRAGQDKITKILDLKDVS